MPSDCVVKVGVMITTVVQMKSTRGCEFSLDSIPEVSNGFTYRMCVKCDRCVQVGSAKTEANSNAIKFTHALKLHT
jgi:flavoprotein